MTRPPISVVAAGSNPECWVASAPAHPDEMTIAEMIALPRVPWACMSNAQIGGVAHEAADAGDVVLLTRARRALRRRGLPASWSSAAMARARAARKAS